MGRSSRSSPGFSTRGVGPKSTTSSSSSASSRTQTREASTTTSSVPATTRPAAPPAHAPQQTQVPTAVPSGGPGIMGQIAANAASTAIGITGAHALIDAFGIHGHSRGERDATSEQQAAIAQARSREEEGPCGIQFKSFMKCLDVNNNNVSSCQWAYDMLAECKKTPGSYMNV